MPRFVELTSYWRRFPPEHLALAAIKAGLGIKSAETKQRTGTDDEYVPPEFESSRDLTHLVTPSSPFGDAFQIQQMKVVQIDSRKKS